MTPLEYAIPNPAVGENEMIDRLMDLEPAALAEYLTSVGLNTAFLGNVPKAFKNLGTGRPFAALGNAAGVIGSTPAVSFGAGAIPGIRDFSAGLGELGQHGGDIGQQLSNTATSLGDLSETISPRMQNGEVQNPGPILGALQDTQSAMGGMTDALTKLNPWVQAAIIGGLGLGAGKLGLDVYDRYKGDKKSPAKRKSTSPRAPARRPGHMRVDIPADRISPQFYQALSRDMLFNPEEEKEEEKKAASVAMGFTKRSKYDGKRTFVNSNLTNRWDNRVLDELNQGRDVSPDELMELKSKHIENQRMQMEMEQQQALGMPPGGSTSAAPAMPEPATGFAPRPPGVLTERAQKLKERIEATGKKASVKDAGLGDIINSWFIDPVKNIPARMYGLQHEARKGNWRGAGRNALNLVGDVGTTALNASIPFTGGASLGARGLWAGGRGAASTVGRKALQSGGGWRNFRNAVGMSAGYSTSDAASRAGRGDPYMPEALRRYQQQPEAQDYYQAYGIDPIKPDQFMHKYQSESRIKSALINPFQGTTRSDVIDTAKGIGDAFTQTAVNTSAFMNNRRKDLKYGPAALHEAGAFIPGYRNKEKAKQYASQMPAVQYSKNRYENLEQERARNLAAEDAVQAEDQRHQQLTSGGSGWEQMLQYLPQLLPFLAPFLQGGGQQSQYGQQYAPGYAGGYGQGNQVAQAYNQWR